jgi:hypothetical protein
MKIGDITAERMPGVVSVESKFTWPGKTKASQRRERAPA